MDRNWKSWTKSITHCTVALLAEGVDRNLVSAISVLPYTSVALLAEGVDRNSMRLRAASTFSLSPSSRRAWIEIMSGKPAQASSGVALLAEGVDRNTSKARVLMGNCYVALLAEGVDRNSDDAFAYWAKMASPSSRRAWIEILTGSRPKAESRCRPPRGGRG